jgi:cytochrome c
MKYLIAALTLALATPAFADDPVAGEADFKKCKACHMITAPDGTAIQKGGKVGPDLWGVIGRQIGSLEGFAYSAGTVAAGADGTVWDEEMLAAYVVDPSAWLAEKTGDAGAKSKMSFKLKEGGEDIAAYLASLNPAE